MVRREFNSRLSGDWSWRPGRSICTARNTHNLRKDQHLNKDQHLSKDQCRRSDRCDQLGRILNQLLGSRGEDIELRAPDDETKVFEEAADLVLEVTLDLDQQRQARRSALTE